MSGGGAHGFNRLSNACPRCGWFVRQLGRWPHWDEAQHTPAGRAVLSARAWGEICAVVRAASKALVVPYALLNLPSTVFGSGGGSGGMGGLLALAYLLPFVFHHVNQLSPAAFYYRPRRRAHWPQRRQQQQQQQQQQNQQHPAHDDGTSCGAAALASGHENERVAPSEALEAVTTATPSHVFLAEGDVCPICLEDIGSAAAIVAVTAPEELRTTLQALRPPLVVLRCGHALHLECAETTVHFANGRHMRCPLCREPASLRGAVVARAFS